MAIYLHKYFPKLSDNFLLLGLLSPCANQPIMALFNAAFSKITIFIFLFKYVSIPMIILNEHVHLNMIDVYQEKQEWHSENVPISWTSFHQKKIPRETHFSANSSKRFSGQKKSYPPAGLFQITIFRRCDPRTRTWSDSASEDYASSSFPFERVSELPATFHSQAIVKDPSTEYQGSQKNFPSRGYSNKTKDHQRSQYSHIQMTSGNLFFQLEA